MARLGRLERRGAIWHAESGDMGPALLGLFRQKIIVPADFATRYDAVEQALIVAHEERHALRGDPLSNAIAALLQCAFWFNPLIHSAASRFRFDQELACDADVIERHPGREKPYAQAMLKTQTGGAPALAACHWQSSHPLKERIMFLKQTSPTLLRRSGGRLIATMLVCASALGAVVANAETPKSAPARYLVSMTIESGGETSSPKVHVSEGARFQVRKSTSVAGKESTFSNDMTVAPWRGDSVMVAMNVKVNGQTVSEPKMGLALDQPGTLRIDGKDGNGPYNMTIKVSMLDAAKSGS